MMPPSLLNMRRLKWTWKRKWRNGRRLAQSWKKCRHEQGRLGTAGRTIAGIGVTNCTDLLLDQGAVQPGHCTDHYLPGSSILCNQKNPVILATF